MSERTLSVLLPHEVEAQWEILSGFLSVEKYCQGELTSQDILELVRNDRAFILVLKEGSLILCAGAFEVMTFAKRTVLNAIMIGGTQVKSVMDEFMGQLSAFARALGADAVRGYVRPSMARLLKKLNPGTRDIYTVVEIAL